MSQMRFENGLRFAQTGPPGVEQFFQAVLLWQKQHPVGAGLLITAAVWLFVIVVVFCSRP